MQLDQFERPAGATVPAVTAAEMRDVDRVATEVVGLSLTRMMEHAGRSLARQALSLADGQATADDPIVVLAGAGGNGGGGLVCARHLANRGVPTTVVLDHEREAVTGVPGEQLAILEHLGNVRIVPPSEMGDLPILETAAVVDSLLGYGLEGAPRGAAATLIEQTRDSSTPILSLDVPSGMDATTGDRPGAVIRPERTLTLALPKTGLTALTGDLFLADLSIPATVYEQLDIPDGRPFGDEFVVALRTQT